MPEPPTKVAAPPSLRVSVGVPPVVLTVTAALKLTVSVTAWPAFRSPLPPVIPVPELAIEEIAVAVVLICSVPAGLLLVAADRSATLPAPSLTVAPLRLKADTIRSGVFCPAATV